MAKTYLNKADMTLLLVTVHDEATQMWLDNGHVDTPQSAHMMQVYETYVERFGITQDDIDDYNASMTALNETARPRPNVNDLVVLERLPNGAIIRVEFVTPGSVASPKWVQCVLDGGEYEFKQLMSLNDSYKRYELVPVVAS